MVKAASTSSAISADSVVFTKTVTHTVYATRNADSAASTTPPLSSMQPATTDSAVAVSVSDVPAYMAVVNRWRAKMKLKALARSTRLEANAMDTVTSGNGKMVHKLNSGTFGQVLAPGTVDEFEHVFVGGWLCEMPGLPDLAGVCTAEAAGWAHHGQTGHAQILTSGQYANIGCAVHAGIWCCDLA